MRCGFFLRMRERARMAKKRGDDADVFGVDFEGVAPPVFVGCCVCVKGDKFGDDEGEYFFGMERPG